MQCPGQDTRYWKPGAIYELSCPTCGARVEFFKDDPARRCPRCAERIPNPRRDVGCAEWCPHAKDCVAMGSPPAMDHREPRPWETPEEPGSK